MGTGAGSKRQAIRPQGVLAVVGMALVWPSIQNQILYPATFMYAKPDAPSVYPFYLVYVAFFVACCALVAANRERVARTLLASGPAMLAFGLAGSLGTALVVLSDFATGVATALAGAGMALAAVYVPVHFAFWCSRIVGLGGGSFERGYVVALATAASYVLFCAFTALRLALGVHASAVAIVYPAAAGALALVAVHRTPFEVASGSSSLRQLPVGTLVPSVAFVYLCSLIIIALNPQSASSQYPPSRALLYLIDALLVAAIGLLYHRNPCANRRTTVQAFGLLSVYLVGVVLLTALGTLSAFDLGNFPTIAGKNAFDFFILLVVLVSAHNKHVNPVSHAMLYLAVVIALPNAASAAAMYLKGALAIPDSGGFTVAVFLLVVAFGISAAANVILAFFVTRRAKPTANDAEELLPDPAEETYRLVQDAWGLSDREVEIARLVCRDFSAARIAESLSIAESTVYTHFKRIYRKAGVHSRQELKTLIETFRK